MQPSAKAPKVLITGGLGHIGSRLIRFLRDNMTVVDDLSTERYCSLFNFKASTEHEIRFWPRDFGTLTKKELSHFDIIIHLAARTNAAASFKNRDDVEKVNVKQTLELIEKATDAGIKLFVFPSSTSVYGVAKEVVIEDDPECIKPQSPYAESKITIENALKSSKLPHIVFRFGTIYGISPGMRFHTAINKFCFQASIGQPLTIWKQNYYQKRPYLDLRDAITAIGWMINLASKRPEILNQVYNVASGNHTVAEVVQTIKRHINIWIKLVDTPLLNQYSYEVSCKKIAALGYTVDGSLERGIEMTLRLLSRIRCV